MKTEVRRGRKFVEYIDDSLPVGTFVQEIGAHDVSYQDENSVWRPIDENWETDGQDGFSFRAQRMNHKVRFDSIGAWRWYPRRNVETEYIVINRPRCWLTRTNRWGYLLANGISREGKDITITSLRNVTRVIHSRWNGIKTDWILENADAPTRFQQQIDLVGLTEVDGWLYGADGEQVARLTPTTAIDAEGNELPCSGTYSNGFVEFQADVTGAVYPVTIDPDFAGDAGDGYIASPTESVALDSRLTSGATNLVSDTMPVGYQKVFSKFRTNRAYLKFDTSGITDTDTVTQVNLKLVCGADYSTENDFDVQIVKQNWGSLDLTNATDRETAFDGCLSGTADSSIWRNTSGISTDTQYTSGNLATDWINKTGYTYYSLRTSRDYNGDDFTANTYITIAASNNATEAYRPVLAVTHSEGGGAQNLTLSCAAGSYSQTGTDATLTYTGSAQNLTLSCGAGSLALTGTNADITSSRTLICEPASGGAYPDIIVSGAGTTDANGTYTYAGTYSGKAYYENGSNLIAWYDTGGFTLWSITIDGNPVYASFDDVATPDLVTAWELNGTGQLPVPTVAAGASLGYILTGSDVTLTYTQGAQNLTLSCGAGSLALTGSACTLSVKRNYVLTCGAGSYAVTGTSASFEVKRNFVLAVTQTTPDVVASGAGTTVVNGLYKYVNYEQYFKNDASAVVFKAVYGKWYVGGINGGVYYSAIKAVDTPDLVDNWQVEIDGTAPVPAFTVSPDVGGAFYSLAGYACTLTYTHAAQNLTLSCGAGSYTLTGTDISFGNTKSYELVCGAGSYTLTGTDVSFGNTIAYSLACNSGSYLLTGTPTSLTSARSLACNSGAYTLTGLEADLFKRLVMPCGNGSYILTGKPASITSGRTFALGMGSYVLVGTDVGLYILTITPDCRTYFIDAENRTHTIDAENRTLEVRCH